VEREERTQDRARLNGFEIAYKQMLQYVQESNGTIVKSCDEAKATHDQVVRSSHGVMDVLKKMLEALTIVRNDEIPSFVQLAPEKVAHALRHLAKMHDQEASWYLAEAHGLNPSEVDDSAKEVSSADDDPMSNIASFVGEVKTDIAAVSAQDDAKVSAACNRLRTHLTERKKEIIKKAEWCATVSQSAEQENGDEARSNVLVGKKAKVLEVASSECQEAMEFADAYQSKSQMAQNALQKIAELEQADAQEQTDAVDSLEQKLTGMVEQFKVTDDNQSKKSAVLTQKLEEHLDIHRQNVVERHRTWAALVGAVSTSHKGLIDQVDAMHLNWKKQQRMLDRARSFLSNGDADILSSLAQNFHALVAKQCPDKVQERLVTQQKSLSKQLDDLQELCRG
jgi:hypothetical protein